MWFFTTQGFISAVRHPQYHDSLLVRARRPDHIAALFPDVTIEQEANTDYKYSATIRKLDALPVFSSLILDIDYRSLREEIQDHHYYDACSRVWGVMHSIQPGSHFPPDFGQEDLSDAEAQRDEGPKGQHDWRSRSWL